MAHNVIRRVWNRNRLVKIDDLQGMVFQSERYGHTFEISCIDDDGTPVTLTGTPTGVFIRPDNTDQLLECVLQDGKVYVDLPAGCYDVPGRFGMTVFLEDGAYKPAIYAAIGTIARSYTNNVSPGTTATIDDLINKINEMIATVPTLESLLLQINTMIETIPDDYSEFYSEAIKSFRKFEYGETIYTPYDNFNTFPPNEVVYLFANTVSTNSPDPITGLIVFTLDTSENGDIKYQIAIPVYSGTLRPEASYTRFKIASTWQAWNKNYNSNALFHSSGVGEYDPGVAMPAPYDNANTFPRNTAVLAYANRNIQNLPGTGVYNVFTFASNLEYGNMTTQLAVGLLDNSVYVRSNGNSWLAWQKIDNNAIIVNPEDNLVTALQNASALGNVTVIINGGTHDILTEYGIQNDTVFPADFDFNGVRVGNNITIKAVNGAKIQALYTGSNDQVKTDFSPLYIAGNCELVGLNIEVQNVRYCIHDDPWIMFPQTSSYLLKVSDCSFKHNGSNGSYHPQMCIGGGTTLASQHVYERCVFESLAEVLYPVSYHNGQGNAYTARVSVVNCVMKNGGTLRLFGYVEGGSYVDALFCGNYVGASAHFDGQQDRFRLFEFNNYIPSSL